MTSCGECAAAPDPIDQDLIKVQEQIEFFRTLIDAINKSGCVEGFYGSFHIRKKGRLYHHIISENFMTGDFGRVLLELASDMKKQESYAAVGRDKA